jgi:spoIIIJ-associated protein
MNKDFLKNFIKEFIEKTSFEVKDIVLNEEADKNIVFSLEIEKSHLFTNKNGEALKSLNYIMKRILEKQDDSFSDVSVLLDIDNFHKKNNDSIKAIAHMMAERARYFKSKIELDPMSAFERRIVHEFLSEAEDIETESVGEGRDRKIVIKYVGSI